MANIDLFTPRTMLPMVQEATKRNPTWLRDTFFRGRQTFNTPTVEFDVIGREGREMAAFVNPDMPGEGAVHEGQPHGGRSASLSFLRGRLRTGLHLLLCAAYSPPGKRHFRRRAQRGSLCDRRCEAAQRRPARSERKAALFRETTVRMV